MGDYAMQTRAVWLGDQSSGRSWYGTQIDA